MPTPLGTEISEGEWLNQQAEILHRSQDCEEGNSKPFPSVSEPLPQERGAKSSDESSEEVRLNCVLSVLVWYFLLLFLASLCQNNCLMITGSL